MNKKDLKPRYKKNKKIKPETARKKLVEFDDIVYIKKLLKTDTNKLWKYLQKKET